MANIEKNDEVRNEEITEINDSDVSLNGDATAVKGKKKSLGTKIKELFSFVKAHWNKPPEGKYLSFKEIASYCVGGMGVHGGMVLITYVTLGYGFYIAVSLGFNNTQIMLTGIITSIITILRSPLISMIVDNVQTKMGKFRHWLIWLAAPIVVCFILLGWVPIYINDMIARLVVFIIIFNVLQFLLGIYTLSYTTLVQVISPLESERTQLMSIGAFIYSLGPSITTMLFPLIANFAFSYGVDGSGINHINSYKYVLPAIALAFFALGILAAVGTKERTVLSAKNKNKVKFSEGIKSTFKNKFFWLLNLSASLAVLKMIVTAKQVWVYTYMLQNNYAQTIFTSVLGFANVPGMLLAPLLIKKIGKKKLVILSNFLIGIFAIPLFFIVSIPGPAAAYLIILIFFFMTAVNAVQVVTLPAMTAQMYDYQQYKTGTRIEGFLSQFGAIIGAAAGIGVAFIEPGIFKHFNYDAADKEALYNRDLLNPLLMSLTGLSIASAVASAIPIFFWNLTEKRHSDIMEILAVRAKHEEGKISDEVANDLIERLENGESGIAKVFFDEMFLEESELSESRKAEIESFEEELMAAQEQMSEDSEKEELDANETGAVKNDTVETDEVEADANENDIDNEKE